jgi:hypothetical protein
MFVCSWVFNVHVSRLKATHNRSRGNENSVYYTPVTMTALSEAIAISNRYNTDLQLSFRALIMSACFYVVLFCVGKGVTAEGSRVQKPSTVCKGYIVSKLIQNHKNPKSLVSEVEEEKFTVTQ